MELGHPLELHPLPAVPPHFVAMATTAPMVLELLVDQGCGLQQAPEHPRQAARTVRLASNVMELEESRSVLKIPTLLPGHQSAPLVVQGRFQVLDLHRHHHASLSVEMVCEEEVKLVMTLT